MTWHYEMMSTNPNTESRHIPFYPNKHPDIMPGKTCLPRVLRSWHKVWEGETERLNECWSSPTRLPPSHPQATEGERQKERERQGGQYEWHMNEWCCEAFCVALIGFEWAVIVWENTVERGDCCTCVRTHTVYWTHRHTHTTTNLANLWVLGTGTKCIISKDSYEAWTCVLAHSLQINAFFPLSSLV